MVVLVLLYSQFINFGAPCPRFKELKKEYTNDSPFAKSINEAPENSKLCQYIIKHAGVKECDFEVISDIWDTLRIQVCKFPVTIKMAKVGAT